MSTQPGSARDRFTIESRAIYDGRIVRLALDTVRFPDGSTGQLELIRHSGAAAVLPVIDRADTADPEILLIRQFRYAAGGALLEIPAGRPDHDGEPWDACARRELQEETGLVADSLVPLTTIFTTPGFTDEVIHLFMATGLRTGPTALDTDEFVEPVPMALSSALERIRQGEISDAKTICSLLFATCFVFRQ